MAESKPIRVFVRSKIKNPESFIIRGPNQIQQNNIITKYDAVYQGNTAGLYDLFGKDCVNQLNAGYNVTVMAYGQTSSGKTYTMCGTPSDPGLIRLISSEIFNPVQLNNSTKTCRVSFLEIYNEKTKDLLDNGKECSIGERKGSFVPIGITRRNCSNVDDIIRVMAEGMQVRATAPTSMNKGSSRSHAILQIEVEQLIPNGNSLKTIKSLISFIDLAGSERVTQSEVVGKNFVEMTNINLSLSTLSRVIHAVVKKEPTVPVRESCLTKLLKDSFGGNSLTWVIATVSGESKHANETANTLKFADITRQVKCIAKINELDRRLDLEDELRLLKTNGGTTKQIQQLQQQLAEYDISYNQALAQLKEAERIAEEETMRRIEAESKHAEISDKFNELTEHVETVRKNIDLGSLQERALQYEKKFLEVSEQLNSMNCLNEELQRQLHESQLVSSMYKDATAKLQQFNEVIGENTSLKEQVKHLLDKVSSLSNEQGQNEVLKAEIAHGKTLLMELREKIKEVEKRNADKELQTNTKAIRSIKTIFEEIEKCATSIEQSTTTDEAIQHIRKLKMNIQIFRQ